MTLSLATAAVCSYAKGAAGACYKLGASSGQQALSSLLQAHHQVNFFKSIFLFINLSIHSLFVAGRLYDNYHPTLRLFYTTFQVDNHLNTISK
jgi:hypothetical protein